MRVTASRTQSIQSEIRGARLAPVDALRGLLIVLMALDHANHFIARAKRNPEMWADLFPTYGSDEILVFLTRFITHLAAPGFFFLMGAGMVLLVQSPSRRAWNRRQVTRHFLLRGALLIMLQYTLENFAWGLKEPLGIYFGVLYGLGGVMILGCFLLRLPPATLTAIGAALILLTELLLPDVRTGYVAYPLIRRLLLLPGSSGPVLVLYPLLPWLGVSALGMAFGKFLGRNPKHAYGRAFWLGLAALLIFIPLRLAGGFGNIRPAAGTGWIALLNLVKYPPSVTFLLLTLGANLVLLALFSKLPAWLLRPLVILGRAPLFFYICHLWLYGILGMLFVPASGIGIPKMLPYWLGGILLLWPLCYLFFRFKFTRPADSFWRLL